MRIGIVDDHVLFRKGLINLLNSLAPKINVVFEAGDGSELQEKLNVVSPDLLLVDINMPKVDGFESVKWVSERFPEIRILVISMLQNDSSIIRMLKLGVKGYLCKDIEPNELVKAIDEVYNRGFYYTDFLTGKLIHSLTSENEESSRHSYSLKDNERQFLHLACSELTYKEIADKMHLSPKTIDGYRISLFEKFEVKSRVGLTIYAIKNGLVEL